MVQVGEPLRSRPQLPAFPDERVVKYKMVRLRELGLDHVSPPVTFGYHTMELDHQRTDSGQHASGGKAVQNVFTVLKVATLLGVSAWAAWRDDAQSLLVALTVLAIAFFVVPTRAHERYLFPFFGLGAVLLAVSWRWSVAYVILAIVNAANLLAVLVEYSGIPAGDGTLARTLNDWGHGLLNATWFGGIIWPVALCSVTVGLAMIWALLQLRPRAVAALSREASSATREPETAGLWSWLAPGLVGGETRGALPSPGLPASTAAAGSAAARGSARQAFDRGSSARSPGHAGRHVGGTSQIRRRNGGAPRRRRRRC